MSPERWHRVCAIFAAALRCSPAEREALLAEACADDPELRAEVERLLADDDAASRDGFLDVPTASVIPLRPDRRGARRPRRPLQDPPAARRGGHGRRLPRRAGPAGPPPRRAQAHQARHGHRPGHRPLRRRAPGPGPDGPPQHRQGARRRRHRQRPALLRDGAGQGRPDHRLLRPATGSRPASGWSCSSRSAGRSSTRTRRGSSTATSSRRTSW